MKWYRRCCCCCCMSVSTEETTINDNSSLIQHNTNPPETEAKAFYIPRRHSSFTPTISNHCSSATHKTSTPSPGSKPHSDSCSSSDEEDGAPLEQRGRSWSTVPSTSSTDAVKGSNPKNNPKSILRESGDPPAKEQQHHLCFDKHILTEIAETTADDDDEDGGEDASPKAPDASDIYGYLTFVTAYDEEELRLSVFVEKASGLPKKGSQGSYNTFVKTSIIYSNKNSLMTRTVKNTLSPIFKEDQVFHTNRSKWSATNQTTLRLSLFDCDRQGRHDAVGHALLPLSQLASKKDKHVLPLTPRSVPVKSPGQVLVGLSYVPTQSLLSVQVLKARRLHIDADTHKRYFRPLTKETMDTYAKVTLMCAGQKVKSNTSRVLFGAHDPFYNFKNSFVLPPQFMLDASVIVSVIVRGILGRSFTLGRVIAGPYTELSDGTPTHWGRMVQENRNVVQWRNLYV